MNLDDTTNCPVAPECQVCNGAAGALLEVATIAYAHLGVGCMTICEPCADRGVLPSINVGPAVESIAAHCTHLGIDLDAMAAQVDVAPPAAAVLRDRS